MAYTEKYVTAGAGGSGDGSIGNPWTFAQGITNGGAGIRVNIKSDAGYSIGATTFPGGSINALSVYRGYATTAGDLDDQSRNADGTLNTTGMPVFTMTADTTWTPGAYLQLQNLNITGSRTITMLGSLAVDQWGIVKCKVTNTANNSGAIAVGFDDGCWLLDSDIYCTGAAHSYLLTADSRTTVMGCRFKATAAASMCDINYGNVSRCVFHGHASSVGIDVLIMFANNMDFMSNTFYGIGTCIQLGSGAPGANASIMTLTENHATDCSKWIDNLRSATESFVAVERRNRLRDITTPRTGMESVIIGEISTDTGDHTTDYVDAPAGDFHLIPTAAGYEAGSLGHDIGAMQHAPVSGGGGGSALFLGGLGQTGIGAF